MVCIELHKIKKIKLQKLIYLIVVNDLVKHRKI